MLSWKEDFAQRKNQEAKHAAAFTVTSHSIFMPVKAIGTSEQTLNDKTVYATPKMMTFGWNIIFLSPTMK